MKLTALSARFSDWPCFLNGFSSGILQLRDLSNIRNPSLVESQVWCHLGVLPTWLPIRITPIHLLFPHLSPAAQTQLSSSLASTCRRLSAPCSAMAAPRMASPIHDLCQMSLSSLYQGSTQCKRQELKCLLGFRALSTTPYLLFCLPCILICGHFIFSSSCRLQDNASWGEGEAVKCSAEDHGEYFKVMFSVVTHTWVHFSQEKQNYERPKSLLNAVPHPWHDLLYICAFLGGRAGAPSGSPSPYLHKCIS